jgi:hypothetical protein
MVLYREAGRVILIPFPAVAEPHSEEERFDHHQKLEKSMQYTSRSIGQFISVGASLSQDEGKTYYKNVIVPFARSCLEGTRRRVLRNYAILLYFAMQVNINVQFLRLLFGVAESILVNLITIVAALTRPRLLVNLTRLYGWINTSG